MSTNSEQQNQQPMRRVLTHDFTTKLVEDAVRQHIIKDATNRGDMSMPATLLYSAMPSASFVYFDKNGDRIEVSRVVMTLELP